MDDFLTLSNTGASSLLVSVTFIRQITAAADSMPGDDGAFILSGYTLTLNSATALSQSLSGSVSNGGSDSSDTGLGTFDVSQTLAADSSGVFELATFNSGLASPAVVPEPSSRPRLRDASGSPHRSRRLPHA